MEKISKVHRVLHVYLKLQLWIIHKLIFMPSAPTIVMDWGILILGCPFVSFLWPRYLKNCKIHQAALHKLFGCRSHQLIMEHLFFAALSTVKKDQNTKYELSCFFFLETKHPPARYIDNMCLMQTDNLQSGYIFLFSDLFAYVLRQNNTTFIIHREEIYCSLINCLFGNNDFFSFPQTYSALLINILWIRSLSKN